MNKLFNCTLLVLLSSSILAQEIEKYLIETEIGEIELVVYPEQAPITVENFRVYVEKELYTNSSFFRVCTPENEADREIRIEVIQGGNVPDSLLLAPIPIETSQKTGIKHVDGTISMARLGPNSAQSSFFICINAQPELDHNGKRNPDGYGFAAFGKVTKGMELVKEIQSEEEVDQYLVNPVKIQSIKRMH
ncbi:peptidylprolyl isomerase [Cyclobacterium marinum]|uniref:Peptidyl-prolyl cis-trans isomerase n=1 Tax=Cyclobacterium marinum (strain ATCC 25205 / DSM 745 / LMG 13164 / NCIMB 1802) TaxID=880070 RepID=G0J7F9_CYCMS|nr:peptidylprolyl isomerase [Cyclobacterium marinum]AEL28613.1 peptidyl-prolyl cis-trans isomerase cyclophilin type [Cyclobacterium marinum DSM 745]